MTARQAWTVGVVVPARNEARTIAACIASLRSGLVAADHPGAEIVIVADSCNDDTADRARRALGSHGAVLEVQAGRVGAARRAGTDHLLAHLRPEAIADRTWVCSTDADSIVPIDWIDRHLRLAEAGAAAVAGTIRVDSFHEHPPSVSRRYERCYAAGIVGARAGLDRTHSHVHGANFGVRADAYLAVGGWSTLHTAEDHDLWQRLKAAGWPTLSSYDTWVTTSGRADGRAPDGFARYLETLAAP